MLNRVVLRIIMNYGVLVICCPRARSRERASTPEIGLLEFPEAGADQPDAWVLHNRSPLQCTSSLR